MTSATLETANPPPRRSIWFANPWFDFLLILGVPYLTWPLIKAAEYAWSPKTLRDLILLTATGHYFATFVRAYGDRELFQRFRGRFLLVPAVLLAVNITMFQQGYSAAVLLVVAGWAWWHWVAQAFGFARIYDIKVGSFRPLTAFLDKALVTSWFLGALVLNAGAVATFSQQVLDAGFAVPSGATWSIVEQVVRGTMLVTAAAYGANVVATLLRKEPLSWAKQFMHVTTIGYYWFAFSYLPNVLVAYVLYELFHDIQYYAITWLTCRQRVRRDGVTSWMRAMFGASWWLSPLLFLAAMTVFGLADLGGRLLLAPGGSERELWLALIATAALLHYYYDGFIWKARERTLGTDLGLSGGLGAAVRPALRHALAWGAFFVPLAFIALAGRSTFAPIERTAMLADIAPNDFKSRADYAHALVSNGEYECGLAHYRASIELHPEFAPTRYNYGAALEFGGRVDAAIEQYRHALEAPDDDDTHQVAHRNLGICLLERGEHAQAKEHLAASRALGGENPITRIHQLVAALGPDQDERKLRLCSVAIAIDPKSVDARLHLAHMLLSRNAFAAAAEQLTTVTTLAPMFVPAYVGLAQAQARLGRRGEAHVTLDRALKISPNDAQALTVRQQLGPR